MDRPAEQSTEPALPTEHTWFAGRRWAGAVNAVLTVVWLYFLVSRIVEGRFDGTMELVSAGIEIVLVIAFPLLAVDEFTRRITVNGDGVHRHSVFGRRTVRWEEIAEVHRPTQERPGVLLVRHHGKDVPLPNSAGQLHTLNRERYRAG